MSKFLHGNDNGAHMAIPIPLVFSENSQAKKFCKRAENAVGKGENACYEQFFLFPKDFYKT